MPGEVADVGERDVDQNAAALLADFRGAELHEFLLFRQGARNDGAVRDDGLRVRIANGLLAKAGLIGVRQEAMQIAGEQMPRATGERLADMGAEVAFEGLVGTGKGRGHRETDDALLIRRQGVGHIGEAEEDGGGEQVLAEDQRTDAGLPADGRAVGLAADDAGIGGGIVWTDAGDALQDPVAREPLVDAAVVEALVGHGSGVASPEKPEEVVGVSPEEAPRQRERPVGGGGQRPEGVALAGGLALQFVDLVGNEEIKNAAEVALDELGGSVPARTGAVRPGHQSRNREGA